MSAAGPVRGQSRKCRCIAHNLVKRCFNEIKPCRRTATRYDKLADNYLAFFKLAAIRILIRAYESMP
jgi:transposase